MIDDFKHVPRRLFDTGLFDLKTEDGQGAFVDACVAVLHGLDEKWGHLKKKSGQAQVHGHGEDSALYLSEIPGQSQAVDFIGGAGGSNPQPGWSVDQPRYSKADWIDPFDHKLNQVSPPSAPKIKPREDFYFDLGQIDGFYKSLVGLQRPGGMVKFDAEGRTIADVEALGAWGYDLILGATVQECIQRIRQSLEWQQKHPNEAP